MNIFPKAQIRLLELRPALRVSDSPSVTQKLYYDFSWWPLLFAVGFQFKNQYIKCVRNTKEKLMVAASHYFYSF